MEEALAFVGGGVVGAADDDAGAGADDFGFGGAVGVGDEAEDAALGDDAAEPRIVKTVRGEGYVLAVEVALSQ